MIDRYFKYFNKIRWLSSCQLYIIYYIIKYYMSLEFIQIHTFQANNVICTINPAIIIRKYRK